MYELEIAWRVFVKLCGPLAVVALAEVALFLAYTFYCKEINDEKDSGK